LQRKKLLKEQAEIWAGSVSERVPASNTTTMSGAAPAVAVRPFSGKQEPSIDLRQCPKASERRPLINRDREQENKVTRSVIAAALLIAASSLPAWAQDSHEGHHPPQASAPVDSQAAPSTAVPSTRAESPSAPSAAQGQMQGGMMNCAMMQGAQPNQGMHCPMMQGMRPGMMQGQMMQPGKAPDGTAETPKPN
jgi:hypothetical protein